MSDKSDLEVNLNLEAANETIAAQAKKLRYLEDLLERQIEAYSKSQRDMEGLTTELRDLRSSMRTLTGLLPICASCKKIRDDQGFWQAVEGYIGTHSEVLFSHGLCPDCMQKLYPEYFGEPSEQNISGKNFIFIDELTGLHNRRGLITQIEEHAGILAGPQKAIVVVLVDVDRLMHINEEFGFKEGDRALIDTANVLKETFRGSDIIARLGGDEFIIIAAGSSLEYTNRIVDRLHSHLEAYKTENKRRFELNLSTKTLAFEPEKTGSINELMKVADEFVYSHK